MSQPVRIGVDTKVTLHFTLRLLSGEIIDSTRTRGPATFTVGDQSLLPGFERALLGLKAGDRRSAVIDARGGFGEHNADNVQVMDRSLFAVDVPLARGLMLWFADKKGELPGVITAFDGDKVTVDFNHPLAGRELGFEVEILDVEPLTTSVAVVVRAAARVEEKP